MSMNLYAIKYKGDEYVGVPENYYIRFEKECGLRPLQVLDEPDRRNLINFLETYNFHGNVILHFQAHGFDTGIVKLRRGESEIGEEASLIKWQVLVELFDRIAIRCNSLYVNLGTVCYSNRIYPYLRNQKFDLLVSNTKVTNPVKPQQLNKEFVRLSTNRALLVDTCDATLDFRLKLNPEIPQ